MQTISPPQAFVDQLIARNFEQLARTLAPDVVARFLLPRGTDEAVGARAVTRRLEGWFGSAWGFTVLTTDAEQVGRRWRLRWKLRMSRDGKSTELIEQVAFVDEGPAGISRLDLLCSGFLPDPCSYGSEVCSLEDRQR